MAGLKLMADDRGVNYPIQSLHIGYETAQAWFDLQPALTQHFFEAQARQLAEAILQNQSQARFNLPDQMITNAARPDVRDQVPSEFREQVIGWMLDRLTHSDLRTLLRQRLAELEESPSKAVSISAQLIRFATARFMLYGMLPSGRSVQYSAPDGEEIPSIPVENPQDLPSAITAQTDAIVETDASEPGPEELLQVPFVAEARRFFLPQWVAVGQVGNLLVNSVSEAKNDLASMQRYLSILHGVIAVAPYFMVDSEYQKKRYGILGQMVNQGRALARYQTQEIIQIIQRRAAAQDLNRGLTLSMPFFDDQALEMHLHDFTVVPAGRILFVPAFLVRACREEQAKVAQDTRMSPSTRKYLLIQLHMLENAFLPTAPTQFNS
jgi:hypothetical protein